MDRLDLQAIIHQYLAAMKLKNQAAKTLEEKTNSLARFLTFVDNRPLTPQIAFDYIIYLKNKPVRPYQNNSLSFEITMLKTFEKWMLKQKYCTEAWTILLERPKRETKEFTYVEPVLIEKAILAGTEPKPFIRRGLPGDNAINKYRKLEARSCLRFVSRKGLRIEEALRLKGTDLNYNLPAPEFRIAPIKGHKETWLEIPADMVDEMREKQGRERVFETTERLCNESLRRGWEAVGLAGKKGMVHNHILRHQHATMLLKAGVPMEKVQKAMRHNSIKITIDTYGHLDNSDINPLVQAADPRTRAALNFKQKTAMLKQVLEKLNFQYDKTLITQIEKDSEGEFVFTMKESRTH